MYLLLQGTNSLLKIVVYKKFFYCIGLSMYHYLSYINTLHKQIESSILDIPKNFVYFTLKFV